jgi:predicted RNA-binding protein
MCEANAYLNKDGREDLVMESVDIIVPESPDSWRLVSIFGNQEIIKGRIKKMNLVNHKIVFEETKDE